MIRGDRKRDNLQRGGVGGGETGGSGGQVFVCEKVISGLLTQCLWVAEGGQQETERGRAASAGDASGLDGGLGLNMEPGSRGNEFIDGFVYFTPRHNKTCNNLNIFIFLTDSLIWLNNVNL